MGMKHIANSWDKGELTLSDINVIGLSNPRIGVIGFGEVGQAFVPHILKKTDQVYVYDILLEEKEHPMASQIEKVGAKIAKSNGEIAETCDLIFLLVPSSSAADVAKEVGQKLRKGSVFLDLTTSTPQLKLSNAQLIEAGGGIYVDIAIMSTVASERHRVPLLIAGEYAEQIKAFLDNYGFNGEAILRPTGSAASIKLIRSIFMKGFEALMLETMITAEKYGVREEVLDSISTTVRNNGFRGLAELSMKTHMIHKQRRYKEVGDSLALIKAAQLPSHVTEGVFNFFAHSVTVDTSDCSLDTELQEILHKYLT